MSVTLVTQPALWEPVNKEMWFRTTSTFSSVESFKYTFKTFRRNEPFTSSTFVPLSIYKVPPRPDGSGLYSPNKPLNSFLEHNVNPFQTGLNHIPFISPSGVPNGVSQYYVQYGMEYNPNIPYYDVNNAGFVYLTFLQPHGLLLNDIITIDKTNKQVNIEYDGTASVTQVISSLIVKVDLTWGVNTPNGTDGGVITNISRISGTSSTRYTWPGTRQYEERERNFSEYIMGLNGPTWMSNSNRFLIDYPGKEKPVILNNETTSNQLAYETLSMIVATASGLSGAAVIKFYDESDTQLSTVTYSIGGANTNLRLDIGVGIANLIDAGVSIPVNWDYYKVGYYQGSTLWSREMKYKKVVECSPFPTTEWVRVLWLNKQGGFDYFTFTRDLKKTVNTQRSIYEKTLDWNYKIGDRSDTVYNTDVNEMFVVQSNWITETEARWLEGLVSSPEVYILSKNQLSGSNKLPIIVTNPLNYEVKTAMRNQMFNITMEYKMAYGVNIQND